MSHATTQPEGYGAARPEEAAGGAEPAGPSITRPRTATTTEEIDRSIIHPGSVRINVKGAFIVDQEPATPVNGGPTSGRGSPSHSSGHETKDIRLPNHTGVVSHIAIDIGGSLAKLVYFSREGSAASPGGRLNFTSFETDRVGDCLAFMRHLQAKQAQSPPGGESLVVVATGGGAYKYYDTIRAALGLGADALQREDEMECLIIGLDFFISEIPREVFTYSETDPMHFEPPRDDIYPYLLVNIGSGVSFLKVTGPREYQRVGGTSLGGGTLWGLLSLLTGARTFDEMLELASRGDNANVDMLVGDIYGADYSKIGLKSSTIASSFGKVFRMKREAESEAEDSGGGLSVGDGDGVEEEERERAFEQWSQRQQQQRQSQNSSLPNGVHSQEPEQQQEEEEEEQQQQPRPPLPKTSSNKPRFSAADMSRSLLYAISNNIGQIAFLQSQIHGPLSHIYFGGSFIRGHPQTMNTLSYAIKFWSQGAKQAYFLRHEGYLGAVGAFLKRQPRNWGRRGSFEDLPLLSGGGVSGGGRAETLEARLRERAGEVPADASTAVAVEDGDAAED